MNAQTEQEIDLQAEREIAELAYQLAMESGFPSDEAVAMADQAVRSVE